MFINGWMYILCYSYIKENCKLVKGMNYSNIKKKLNEIIYIVWFLNEVEK